MTRIMKPLKQGPAALIRQDLVQAQSVAAQPLGALLAIVYSGREPRAANPVLLWDVREQRQARLLAGLSGEVRGVAFSPDGGRLACVGEGTKEFMGGEIRVWDTRTWRGVWTADSDTNGLGTLQSVAFAPDGQTIAVGSAHHGGNRQVGLRDAVNGTPIRAFAEGRSDVSCLAFAPDGRSLAAASNPDVTVRNPATGRARWTRKAHAAYRLCLAFAPDGRTLASCGDRTTVIWDAASGEPLRTLKGHDGDIRALAFSPDGRTLATGGPDAIRLWDVETGQPIGTLEVSGRHPVWVGFWPDSNTLTAVEYTLQIYTWDLTKVARAGAPVPTDPTDRAREDPAFLAAIQAAPHDDAPRLVYADWLEEHGDSSRAEFIRLQCELAELHKTWKLPAAQSRRRNALTKREQKLLAAHQSRWLEPLASIADRIDEAEFERGFLKKLRLTGIGVRDDHLAALQSVPELEDLGLDESGVTDTGMVHLKALLRLSHLTLSGTQVTVAGLKPLRGLKHLVLVYHGGWGNLPNADLERFKAARNRHFLSLPAAARRTEALRAVRILAATIDSDGPDVVRGISFSQSWTTDADLVYLQEFPEVEYLNFYEDSAVTSAGLEYLKGLKNLKHLCLGRSGVTSAERLRHLTGLEDLDLSSLPDLELDSLTHLGALKRLRKLNLSFGEFGDAVIPYLVQLTSLEELELVWNDGTEAGLSPLAGLPKLTRLEADAGKEVLRRLLRK